jgi:hypothetical protein
MVAQGDGTSVVRPARIGERFQVDAVLGRGGMATVYRVTDTAARRSLALKQLDVSGGSAPRADIVALFEREFLVLAQLSHPRIIEVYDYGIDDRAPYYTMELLDGGDLRERSPLPWREACSLLSGVCSSLALIHSRRLVHRDVTPANIRCTRDGEAKLIDFGAMAPVGAVASVVGTPAFVAPEVLHRLALDGRADLFSFGATLYFALTGQSPYPARSFAQLPELWEAPLAPPSRLVDGIPEALDALVLSLLSLEPAMRPRSAFEIMHRLTAIAGVERVEPVSVSQAYLSTPVMVGRDELLRDMRARMTAAFGARGGGVLIDGVSGVGRSRLLDACAVEAKMLGATVLRAGASSAGGEGFAVARMLAEQLLEVIPDAALSSARASAALGVLFESEGASPPRLRTLTSSSVSPLQSQTALCDWVLHVTANHPLAIAVDDVHAIDEPSAALLAALASQASRHPLLLIATAEADSPRARSAAVEVLAGHSVRIELEPLTRAQTEDLLGSLFGDAQNLGPLSDGVHRVSAGNPRACMDLARHLVDKGVVSYDGGAWTLPVRLDSTDLPRTAEEAIRDRVAALQPTSRWLAEAQALADDTFSRGDYQLLRPDSDPNGIDRAISELLSSHLLVGTGKLHSLAHRGWVSALTAGLTPAEREERHRALAVLYEDKLPIVAIRHLLAGGLFERALERLAKLLTTAPDASALGGGAQVPSAAVAATVDSALEAAQALGRPARELHELRRWLVQLSVASEDRFYRRVAPAWLEQLKRDSGFLFWHELGDGAGPGRLKSALAMAAQRYAATPELERVYPPAEAIRLLVYYVIASIAIGSRSMDSDLLESLPPLLEPFAPMSPFADIIRCNALATRQSTSRGQGEQARALWLDVYERLNTMSSAELPYLDRVRYAVAFGIGSQSVRMGLADGATWAELLDKDPRQRVNALYLRKVIALQMGDLEDAERCRRNAEVLALQSMDRQMFTTTLIPELAAHAFCGDLAGVKQVMARIEPLAAASEGWRGYAELAAAQFQQLRGDLEAARAAFARCAARTSRDAAGELRPLVAWAPAVAGHVETLVSLERFDEARAVGEAALVRCQKLGAGFISHGISRALALADAKLGDYAGAVARLDVLIAEQTALGVTGLNLGASYEARARIAIGSDAASFEEYAKRTATEYRHGLGSALGARWERLMAEARRASRRAQPRRADGPSDGLATDVRTTATEMLSKVLADASTARARAEGALRLLCDDRTARTGYLYLVGDGGLSLAASLGSVAAPDGLLQYVQEFFDREVAQNSDQTTALTAAQTSALVERISFRDASGADHRPLLMASLVGGISRFAGVAVFVKRDGPERPASDVTLVGVLTAHLIESGDVRASA